MACIVQLMFVGSICICSVTGLDNLLLFDKHSISTYSKLKCYDFEKHLLTLLKMKKQKSSFFNYKMGI